MSWPNAANGCILTGPRRLLEADERRGRGSRAELARHAVEHRGRTFPAPAGQCERRRLLHPLELRLAPVPEPAVKEGRLGKGDPDLDLAVGTVTCPEGQVVQARCQELNCKYRVSWRPFWASSTEIVVRP
jgi:hypothetical protein